jgi:hypothetical protein
MVRPDHPRSFALTAASALVAIPVLLGACGSSVPPPSAGHVVTHAPEAAASSSMGPGSPTDGAGSPPGVPDCSPPVTPTIAQTEGPYYKAGAPEAADLVTQDMPGTRLTLTGLVVATDCSPVAGARVETWQADATGSYDNEGYTLRATFSPMPTAGSRSTPGPWRVRPDRAHPRQLTPPGGATLTQLYFPGSSQNGGDRIYDDSLLLDIGASGDT